MSNCACGEEFSFDCHVVHGLRPKDGSADDILICANVDQFDSSLQFEHGHILIAKPGQPWYEEKSDGGDEKNEKSESPSKE